jgi:hypothetical protein
MNLMDGSIWCFKKSLVSACASTNGQLTENHFHTDPLIVDGKR